mgnify:FL=1
MSVMAIQNDESSRVTYRTREAAQSLVNCIPFLDGFQDGFQAVATISKGRYSIAVYDPYLRKVGWVCYG